MQTATKKPFSLYNRVEKAEKMINVKPLHEIDIEHVVELATILIDEEITEVEAIDRTIKLIPRFHFISLDLTYLLEICINEVNVSMIRMNGSQVECETPPCLMEMAYQYLAQKGYSIPVKLN